MAAQCFVLRAAMLSSYSWLAMELRHLRYFVTAAEELNVSRASARLRISQPAVSRPLHDLEDELGVELFNRHKSGLELTPAGDTFLAQTHCALPTGRGTVHRFCGGEVPRSQRRYLCSVPGRRIYSPPWPSRREPHRFARTGRRGQRRCACACRSESTGPSASGLCFLG